MNSKRGGLYVGCGLTAAPPEFVQQVLEYKSSVRELGHTVLDFVLGPATAEEVYDNDINQHVRHCTGMVGVMDYPSTGLGWEMATMVARSAPLLILGKRENARRLNRFILGATVREPTIRFALYDTLLSEDILEFTDSIARGKLPRVPKLDVNNL